MAELPQPDMSHLTAEERRIIEGVLMRQKEEEEQDHEIMRYAISHADRTLSLFVLQTHFRPDTWKSSHESLRIKDFSRNGKLYSRTRFASSD